MPAKGIIPCHCHSHRRRRKVCIKPRIQWTVGPASTCKKKKYKWVCMVIQPNNQRRRNRGKCSYIDANGWKDASDSTYSEKFRCEEKAKPIIESWIIHFMNISPFSVHSYYRGMSRWVHLKSSPLSSSTSS